MNLYPLSLCLWPDPCVHADYISNLLLSSFFHKQTWPDVCCCYLIVLASTWGVVVTKKQKLLSKPKKKKKKKLCNKRTNGIHGSLKSPQTKI